MADANRLGTSLIKGRKRSTSLPHKSGQDHLRMSWSVCKKSSFVFRWTCLWEVSGWPWSHLFIRGSHCYLHDKSQNFGISKEVLERRMACTHALSHGNMALVVNPHVWNVDLMQIGRLDRNQFFIYLAYICCILVRVCVCVYVIYICIYIYIYIYTYIICCSTCMLERLHFTVRV